MPHRDLVFKVWVTLVALFMSSQAGVGQTSDFSHGDFNHDAPFPGARAAGLIGTCLKGTDMRRGRPEERCLGLVAQRCLKVSGPSTMDMATCVLLEAQVWAGFLDHDLGYTLAEARAADQGCFTYLNPAGPAQGTGPGPVEKVLRKAQALWIEMEAATCDFAYKADGEASMRNTDDAACVRDLVYSRQQFFWQSSHNGDGDNDDPAAADLRYDAQVAPFAFRPQDEQPRLRPK